MILEQTWIWLFQDDHALTIAQLFAAFVTALATIALWRVTRVLAIETKTLAKMTASPFVICTLESSLASSVMFDLAFQNTGNATAFDIEGTISPDLPKLGTSQDEIDEKNIKISILPPGQRLPIKGARGPDMSEQIFDVKVSWASSPGSALREEVSYSIRALDGFRGSFNVKGVHDVANELEKLRKAMTSK